MQQSKVKQNEYCPIYRGGIACESILKVGTVATAICLDDCKSGAFDFQTYLLHVSQKEHKNMTIESLKAKIDWTHLRTGHIRKKGFALRIY
ncbi:hypothetical protein CVT25_004784 [Psilocybe cyanescens]|uniref:Uncharacterized protein n=1 Tax=Psilocybe cyanescens TaxID=93625 RepID=A0A409XGI5_PSICY|nr:hypothetical protein CVT25_004784 [Psilocybe cyanescens]